MRYRKIARHINSLSSQANEHGTDLSKVGNCCPFKPPCDKPVRMNPTKDVTSFGSIAGSRDASPTVTLVNASDWTGLFVNGALKYEGHSIPEFRMLELLESVGPYKHEEFTANDQVLE